MLGKSILPTDEELGKKDDDHKPGALSRSWKPADTWKYSKKPFRWRRRRVVLGVVGLYLVYLLFQRMPAIGGLKTPPVPWSVPVTSSEEFEDEPTGAPPGMHPPRAGEAPSREYSGQIRFYRLAVSLRGASHTMGYSTVNRNVLFAFSNLKSASTLLPMVCEMSKWNRNHVHAAFMGREDIPLADLLEINGIDKEACPAMWHDARPDYMEYSTDERAESSVVSALSHIQSFLHPQVAIIDDSVSEDAFFVRGMRVKAKSIGIPIIEIAKDQWQNFLWIARLDAGSLRGWHDPTVDILIQARSDSSGGLLRLLKSLKRADYSGLKPPRLTIELPADVDSSVSDYLEGFTWPPTSDDNPLASSQLTIRRRITNQRARQEDSAIRFLELFYPTSTTNSHVLLLSPNAELSPLYYHYLKYVALEYKYCSYGQDDSADIMGVSLERPTVRLDGETKFTAPSSADMHDTRYTDLFSKVQNVPFLWQAPNSHAALFFGDKWAELHSFVSNRVAKQHQASKVVARPKVVSETEPAWAEYMLELMRARGYSLLYPATVGAESLVTMHNELYHAPEEFSLDAQAVGGKGAVSPPKLADEPFLRAETPPHPPTNPEPAVIPFSRPLHLALPFDGDLPEVGHLPYLSTDGKIISPENVSTIASAYANEFRETVGGCTIPKGKLRIVEKGSAKDLFCFGDEDEDDWEDDFRSTFKVGTEDPDMSGGNTSSDALERTATTAETTATEKASASTEGD